MKLTKYLNNLVSPFKNNEKNFRRYLFLVLFRFFLVFVQIGQIHPDEFFQSVEVLTADQFNLEHTRTWEFNNTFPIRSISVPYILIKIPLSFFEFISVYMKYYLQLDIKCAYAFLVYPRLLMCLLSLINDWSLYKICESYSLRYETRLFALGSSFVMLVFGTRTFSNTIEMAICSLLLYLVADCMIHSNTVIYKKEFLEKSYGNATSISEKVKIWKLTKALPAHSFNRLAMMSTLCVLGIFNRPTFFAFGAPMVFFWMLRGLGTKTITFLDFNIRMSLFVLSALPTLFFCVICDSLYYKYLTTSEIQMLEFGLDNFVVTPWNFIKYNLDPSKTAEHGVHPKWLHIMVNVPLLYNVLGIIAIASFGIMLFNFIVGNYLQLPRAQSIVGLMTASIFTPTLALSLINHQEPRFLIPITLPIIFLHSPKLITGFCSQYPFKEKSKILKFFYENFLSTKASAEILFKVWCFFNICLIIFYGFLHQGGVYQLASYFNNIMKIKPVSTNIHLITSHCYQMPISLLNIPSAKVLHVNQETKQQFGRRKNFYLHEYGSLNLDKLLPKLKLIIDVNEMRLHSTKDDNTKIVPIKGYEIYFTIPTSMSETLAHEFEQINSTTLKYELVKIFYPHLSIEALPNFFGKHECYIRGDSKQSECTIETHNYSIVHFLNKLSALIHQFGLALYKFEIQNK